MVARMRIDIMLQALCLPCNFLCLVMIRLSKCKLIEAESALDFVKHSICLRVFLNKVIHEDGLAKYLFNLMFIGYKYLNIRTRHVIIVKEVYISINEVITKTGCFCIRNLSLYDEYVEFKLIWL